MVLCAAYNCDSTYGQGLSMFCFPKNKTFRKKWVDKLKTTGYSPSQHSKLCEKHFEKSQFAMDPDVARSVGYCKLQLKNDAIPSLFDYTPKDRGDKRKLEVEGEKTTPARKSTALLKRRILEVSDYDDNLDAGQGSSPTVSPTTAASPMYTVATSTSTCTSTDSISDVDIPGSDLETYSVLTQTSYDLVPRRHVKLQTVNFTPEKPCTKSSATQTVINSLPEDLEKSVADSDISKILEDDTTGDPDWCVEDEFSFEEAKDRVTVNQAKDRKFVVFEQCLDELFNVCRVCGGQPNFDKSLKGSCVTVNSSCVCGERFTWCSQPMSGSMPLGNLILAGAILFSGSSPVKILRFLHHAAVQCFCLRTYTNIQSAYLVPAIRNVWTTCQEKLISKILETGEHITVGGDARCCSPGHTAKYGSYSLMDLKSNKILDLQLVQSNEVKNSYNMEMEGLKRCLNYLESTGVEMSHLVTDRHSQVKKFMRTCKPEIQHWFDVWHVAKGIFKKLEAEGKRKLTAVLNDWARSISNHLYWCAASSGGDGDLVQEKWLSILNHVTDVHVGHGERFTECLHAELEERQRGTPSFKALQKVVTRKLLLTDIAKLSLAEQTSGLEAFHKVVCHFAPKLVHYFHSQMEARLYLSALHFNENSARAQAKTKDGQKMYSISYPKSRKGDGIAKEVKEPQSFEYVDSLMVEMLNLREEHHSYSKARENLSIRTSPNPLSHSTPRKPKHEIIAGHKKRFNKS